MHKPHPHPSDDKPLGAPHEMTENARRAFEIEDPREQNQPAKPPKTWKTMPTWKKILVIWFLIVCAFGLYDTIFPSEKSLKLEELMPIMATPTVTQTPTTATSPTVVLSPTITPQLKK